MTLLKCVDGQGHEIYCDKLAVGGKNYWFVVYIWSPNYIYAYCRRNAEKIVKQVWSTAGLRGTLRRRQGTKLGICNWQIKSEQLTDNVIWIHWLRGSSFVQLSVATRFRSVAFLPLLQLCYINLGSRKSKEAWWIRHQFQNRKWQKIRLHLAENVWLAPTSEASLAFGPQVWELFVPLPGWTFSRTRPKNYNIIHTVHMQWHHLCWCHLYI